MRTGSTQIKSRHARTVISQSQQRTRGPKLVQSECAMKDIAGRQAEALLQIEWRQRKHSNDAAAEVWCVACDCIDDQIGSCLPLVFPAASIRQDWRKVLAEQARHVLAGWCE